MLGSMVDQAKNGPLRIATEMGTTVEKINGKLVAGIGKYAFTPKQLETAGILTPGSSAIVDKLIQSGTTVEKAVSPSFFTGKGGAVDLPSYVNNSEIQNSTAISLLQNSQTLLTQTGLITGNEAPTEIAGVVLAGTKSTNGDPTSLSLADISLGTTSAQYAVDMQGLSGLSSAVTAWNNIPGVSKQVATQLGVIASSIDIMKKSFGTLVANRPQNLLVSAKKALEYTSGISNTSTQRSAFSIAEITSNVIPSNELLSITGEVVRTVTTPTESTVDTQLSSQTVLNALGISGIPQSLGNLQIITDSAKVIQSGNIAAISSSVASGINNLPGGMNTITSQLPQSIESLKSAIELARSGGLSSTATNLIESFKKSLSVKDVIGIQSAASTLTTTGSKLPTVGIETYNRQEITTRIDNLLHDKIIPPPNILNNSGSELPRR